jgi:hypothetical protein
VVELSGETSALITLLEGQGKVEKVSVRGLRKITTPTNDTERDFGGLEKGVHVKNERIAQQHRRTDVRVFCIAADCSCPRCYFLQ